MSRSEPGTREDRANLRPELAEIARLKAALLDQARNAIEVRDADRQAISRELHDRLGQYLAVMELELNAIARQGAVPQEVLARLQTLRVLTAQAQQDMADMAWQIRPVSLHGMSLEKACEQLIADWRARSPLSFDLLLSLGAQKLTSAVETTLYRVLQEAVTNAVKHAHATRIGVILRVASREVVLIVEDDGKGFAGDETGTRGAPSPSLGLVGIRERLALVAGTLEIESTPDHGAALLIRVPL
jgi:chemotaxis family two-component system sensor kinase Cph1